MAACFSKALYNDVKVLHVRSGHLWNWYTIQIGDNISRLAGKHASVNISATQFYILLMTEVNFLNVLI